MQPWPMNEVMILGILVALIKIAELATVEPGFGMYAVGALVVLFGDRDEPRHMEDLATRRVRRWRAPSFARTGVTTTGEVPGPQSR